MKPYAELLEFNQPNLLRKRGFTRIRDSFEGQLNHIRFSGFGPIPEDTGLEAYDDVYDTERVSEFAGRWDYGSKNADRLGQAAKDGTPIIKKWIESGEQSMLEMGHATFFVECSRVVSHELVRHRLLSFQQESQRFTKYDEEDAEEMFFWPEEMIEQGEGDFYNKFVLETYKQLRKKGVSPQIARYILPNATRTRMVISGNVREWRHVIKLRLHSSAQPEMRELMQQIYDQLVEVFPQSLEGVLDEGRGIR